MTSLRTIAQETRADIDHQLKQFDSELDSLKRAREKVQAERKKILLNGSDEQLASYDAKNRAALDDLDRKIRDREFQIANLRERSRIAVEREKSATVENLRIKKYADACARLDVFNRKISGDAPFFPPALAAKATLADVTGALALFCQESADLSELVGHINRNLPAGAVPLEPPGKAARFSPAVSGIRSGVKVMTSRLKKAIAEGNSRNRPGGNDSYEQILAEPPPAPKGLEAFVAGGEPAFDPPPLHVQMEIPRLFKDSPSYRIPLHLK